MKKPKKQISISLAERWASEKTPYRILSEKDIEEKKNEKEKFIMESNKRRDDPEESEKFFNALKEEMDKEKNSYTRMERKSLKKAK